MSSDHGSRLRDLTMALPRRKEYLGGQLTSYVQLDSVLAIIEDACVIGVYCKDHGFIHGAEAEELRERIQALLSGQESPYPRGGRELTTAIWRLLDDVDARDSCAFLDAKPAALLRASTSAPPEKEPDLDVAVSDSYDLGYKHGYEDGRLPQPTASVSALSPEPALCHCGHEREWHAYYPAGGIFTNCRKWDCKCEAYEPDKAALSPSSSPSANREPQPASFSELARNLVDALTPLLDNADGHDVSNVRAAFRLGGWSAELLDAETKARIEWKELRRAVSALREPPSPSALQPQEGKDR